MELFGEDVGWGFWIVVWWIGRERRVVEGMVGRGVFEEKIRNVEKLGERDGGKGK